MVDHYKTLKILSLTMVVFAMAALSTVFFLVKKGAFNKARSEPTPSRLLTAATPIETWKTLSSDICHIALSYPESWKGTMADGRHGCFFKVEDPEEKINYFVLNSVNTTWEEVVNRNKNFSNIRVAEARGLKASVISEPTLVTEGIYFHKGNVVFDSTYSFHPSDAEAKQLYEKIISTIRFTGSAKDYETKIGDSLQEYLDEANNQAIKMDFSNLQRSLENYKKQKGTYPSNLPILVEAGFIRTIPTNHRTKAPLDYAFTPNGGYILSTPLSNGEIYKVTN